MDARTNANIGFLVIVILSIAIASGGVPQSRRAGFVYVSIQAGNCTQTNLRLEIDGVTPKPESVVLRVRRDSDNAEVVNELLKLSDDGNYYWSGLLAPLGKHRAEIFDEKNKSVAIGKPFVFNNIDLLKNFITERRGEITYISRGGDGTNAAQNDHEKRTLTVDRLSPQTADHQIHIVVINDRGNKADEYYGPAPREGRWRSKPLRFGPYRLIVADYLRNQSCRVISVNE
jgi:hypothetical protein